MKFVVFYVRCMALILVAAWLAGCVQSKPTPGYARTGDHIVLGLGGILRNAGGARLLTPEDLTIKLTDANSVQHTLKARYVFRAYPDHGATMNTLTLQGAYPQLGLTNMVPFDGGWFAVTPLTVPDQYDSPLPLAVGPATLSITSNKLNNINNSAEGDLTAIPIEILPGVSVQDVDYARQFLGYVSNTSGFVITPGSLAGISAVGGASLVINYSDDNFFNSGLDPMVVPIDQHPYVQLNYNVVPNGDGSGSIIVTLLNPAGFKTQATAEANSALLSHLGVKLLYFSDGTAAAAKANFSLDVDRSYYIDMNGTMLPGVSPYLTHLHDL